MKAKDIPNFQKYLAGIIEAYPIYNRGKYFNTLYKMYSKRDTKINALWEKA